MNILIIGEFSSFAKQLKEGFKQLGHDVSVVMTCDGWKKITGDRDDLVYEENNVSLFGRRIPHTAFVSVIKANCRINRHLKKRFENSKIDLIVVINYIFLSSNWRQAGVSLKYIDDQIKRGAKLIMSACGGDPATRFSHPDVYKEWGINTEGRIDDIRYSYLLKRSDVIIPTAYAYYDALFGYYKHHKFNTDKISPSIPLPIKLDKEYHIDSCVGRKVVIFHGIIRPLMKGSYFIQKAMERIQNDYPDKVECICKGHMPYEEYLTVFEKVDILIDQASGEDAWGMNATIGAMKGKCVLVSSGIKNTENMGLQIVPFVEIQRNEDVIYEKLKQLILDPSLIDQYKESSRRFVEMYCDCNVVAKRYMNLVKL